MNPDCRGGKHDACNGDAWNFQLDQPSECQCECHSEETTMTDTTDPTTLAEPASHKYRKKPVEIEARQWDGTAAGAGPIINWILANDRTARYHGSTPADPNCPTPEYHETHVYCPGCPFAIGSEKLAIDTLEGTISASAEDFIIRGVQGEFYPCKPDIFAATYDAVTG